MARHVGLTIRQLADKSVGERIPTLVADRAAVVTTDDGKVVIDPARTTRILVNPETPGYDHEPWPTAGWAFEGDPPTHAIIPTTAINRWRGEGFVRLENERVAHAPSGPAHDPHSTPAHTFIEADAIIFQTVDGDIRYRVTRQPGKYDDPDEASGKRVDWYYLAERQ